MWLRGQQFNARLQTALSPFPSDIQTELRNRLGDRGGTIPGAIAARWIEAMAIDCGDLMMHLLPVAACYARVPVSNFCVGAVARGMPSAFSDSELGNFYLGANLEFAGVALSFSIHAEQAAVNHAWLHGETGLRAIAIDAPPCGYCRQFLNELATPGRELEILVKSDRNPSHFTYTSAPLSHFLPRSFGPQAVGIQGGLMAPQTHQLAATDRAIENCQPNPPNDLNCELLRDRLVAAAIEAASASYAPYTRNYAGVAIQDASDRIYSGRYAENAAHNPSFSPLASAFALANASSPPQAELAITAAVLAERKAIASQLHVTQALLKAIAPGVPLTYIPLDEAGDRSVASRV